MTGRLSRIEHSAKQNKRERENPELFEKYKQCRKNKRKGYYLKNREKILELRRELIKLSNEIGNCSNCYKPKEQDKYGWCEVCRKRAREYNKEYRKLKK